MRKKILLLSSMAAVIATVVISCNSSNTKTGVAVTVSNDSLVKRGGYLVTIMGCDDCHSPKKMGPGGPEIIAELRLSGYPADRPVAKIDTNVLRNGWVLLGADLTSAVGPWGMSFAANITSDETGIGKWSEANFRKSITEGKWKGLDNSRMLLPPMPWFNLRNIQEEDLKAIFAFLKSTKPVKNVVPAAKQLAQL